jgi:hypothetical protein
MTFLRSFRHRLPAVATAWWLAYASLAVFWSLGGPGWPFAVERPAAQAGALLVGVDPSVAAPVVGVLSLAAAAANLALTRSWGLSRHRAAQLAWATVLVTALVVPDARLLLTFFQLLTGNTSGLVWPVVNQAVCVVGALLTAAAVRSTRERVPAARPVWAGAAVACAVGAPLAYAAIRGAWALGLSIGATDAFLEPYAVTGARITEAIIAGAATAGALLTLGLVRPWGEAVPRWIPGLAGRRIPPLVAVIPATAAAILLISAGIALSRGLLAMALGLTPATEAAALANWGAWIAAPLWGMWGLALAAATYGYHLRRSPRGLEAVTA